jgi:hypothetical protein
LAQSNFVFRANERFFEEYLMLKVLQPFFAGEGPIKMAQTDLERTPRMILPSEPMIW